MLHSILKPNKSQMPSMLNLYRVWVMNHSFFLFVSLWLTLPMDIINLRCEGKIILLERLQLNN